MFLDDQDICDYYDGIVEELSPSQDYGLFTDTPSKLPLREASSSSLLSVSSSPPITILPNGTIGARDPSSGMLSSVGSPTSVGGRPTLTSRLYSHEVLPPSPHFGARGGITSGRGPPSPLPNDQVWMQPWETGSQSTLETSITFSCSSPSSSSGDYQ